MKQFLRNLGPGLITAALVFGPGSITVTTKLGAGYGYAQLWIILLSMFFMVTYAKLATRLGLRLPHSMMHEVRQSYGRWAPIGLGIGIFAITASFQAGNSIGGGVAFAELFGHRSAVWVALISLGAIAMVLNRSFYKILERVMIALVALMLTSFLLTVIISQPNLVEVAAGFLPTVPSGAELLSIALVASSFSIVGAFYQAYLVQEKKWQIEDEPLAVRESRNGIIILGLLSSLVLVCAASVLHGHQEEVTATSDLAAAIEPLFGRASSQAFMVGFFAASFSSLIGNATIGGSILADAFGVDNSLESWSVRGLIICIIVIGAAVAMIFGGLPLQLIVLAQAATILVAPAAALVLLLLSVGKPALRPRGVSGLLAVLGFVLLMTLAGYNLTRLFF